MATKLSKERLYLNCSLEFIYSMLSQINSSIEINIIYTVYMTAEKFSWMKITKVEFTKYLKMTPQELSKEGLETVL